jgi:tungstate transport system ATP-binding protein
MLTLQAHNLTQTYNGREVLRNINLAIPAGARYTIVGPNGSGKSTLLRLLASLENPTRGEIHYFRGEEKINDGLALRRRMVMALQKPLLFHTTVLGNVLYGLRVRGVARLQAKAQALSALARAGLADFAYRPAQELSGGESQLVGLIRAIALEPEVLLLDEVTSHLDPTNEARAETMLQQISQAHNTTLILVTQNLALARRFADQGAILYEGEIIAQGPLPELFQAPKDPRIENFIRGHTLL